MPVDWVQLNSYEKFTEKGWLLVYRGYIAKKKRQ